MEAKETIAAQWGKFALWVRTERERRGWSQEEAALKIGKTKMTWYRVEKGEPTKRETVLLIADVFHAPRPYVLGLAGFSSETNEQLSTPQRLAQILAEAMDEKTLSVWLAIGHVLYDRDTQQSRITPSPISTGAHNSEARESTGTGDTTPGEPPPGYEEGELIPLEPWTPGRSTGGQGGKN